MTGFHEVRFPMRLALGAVGGPEWQTEIIALASGLEVRNARWARPRRRWDVGGALTDLTSLQALVNFHAARSGRLFGFRFRDPLDFSSAEPGRNTHFQDQTIGTGDGSARSFQLIKAALGSVRDITKPVADTVQIGVDGNLTDTGWTLDHTAGLVTFETPPEIGREITAGFEFDCAVRFDDDQIRAVIEAYGAGRIASIGLSELPVSAL